MTIHNRKLLERNPAVAYVKGICIILMVYCHAGGPYGHDFIYMFHMLVFFFMSGFCFNIKYVYKHWAHLL